MSEEVITISQADLIARLVTFRDDLVKELVFWSEGDGLESMAKVQAFELAIGMLNAAVFNACADSNVEVGL